MSRNNPDKSLHALFLSGLEPLYDECCRYLANQPLPDNCIVRQRVLVFFLQFIVFEFVQGKIENPEYNHILKDLADASDKGSKDFYEKMLKPLFNHGLTEWIYRLATIRSELPETDFSCRTSKSHPVDEQNISFPIDIIKKLILFLGEFTYHPDDNLEDVYITPNILEKVFIHYLPYSQKTLGTYYTPDEIVNDMCQRSLFTYLKTGHQETDTCIHQWINNRDDHLFDRYPEQKAIIYEKLRALKIYDPATGCGAFPMGMLKLLSRCMSLASGNPLPTEILKHIFNQIIYISDIDDLAVQVTEARLLLWIMQFDSLSEWTPNDYAIHSQAADSVISNTYPDNYFNIVIGNPPYGVKLSGSAKKQYKKAFNRLEGRFDIYMAFFELGMRLTSQVLCYITPDKWLSKSFALKFRKECMIPYMTSVVHYGNDNFNQALVDAIVFVMDKKCAHQNMQVLCGTSQHTVVLKRTVDKSCIKAPYLIDSFFLDELPKLVGRMENCPYRLGDFIHCEYVCANGADAYILKPLIHEDKAPGRGILKMLTTGTIQKFQSCWGKKKMRFIRDDYIYPGVSIDSLKDKLGDGFAKKICCPKLLIKGLNLLDCTLDLNGSYMSHVGTLMVRAQSIDMLCLAAAILNASIVTDYYKSKYVTGSYCGGLLFTPEMISSLPVPDLSQTEQYNDITTLARYAVECEDKTEYQNTLLKLNDLINRRIYNIE